MRQCCLVLMLGAMLFLPSACGLIDALTQFNMDIESEVIVPASSGINLPFDVFSPKVETDASSTFATHDTRKDLVESITLQHLTLHLEAPSGADFSFLESISLFLSAEGEDEIRIAWLEAVPASVDSLVLEVNTAELREYLIQDEVALRVNTKTDEFLTQDHRIRSKAEFRVDAELLGQ